MTLFLVQSKTKLNTWVNKWAPQDCLRPLCKTNTELTGFTLIGQIWEQDLSLLIFFCQQLPQLQFAVELFQISRESISAPNVFLNFHFSLSFVGAAEKTAAPSPRLPSMNTGDGGEAVILQLILALTFQIISVFLRVLAALQLPEERSVRLIQHQRPAPNTSSDPESLPRCRLYMPGRRI